MSYWLTTALALVREPFVLLRPMDYEQPIPAAVRARYARERDTFEETGSPLLPDGLNLGAQLADALAAAQGELPRPPALDSSFTVVELRSPAVPEPDHPGD